MPGPGFVSTHSISKKQPVNPKRRVVIATPMRHFDARRNTMKTKSIKLTKAAAKPGKARPSRFHIESVLVPLDFSGQSKKALAYAVSFAEQFGAKLTLLHVVEPMGTPDFAATFPLALENDKAMAVCKGKLEHLIKEQAIDPKLVEKALVRYGRSFHEITAGQHHRTRSASRTLSGAGRARARA